MGAYAGRIRGFWCLLGLLLLGATFVGSTSLAAEEAEGSLTHYSDRPVVVQGDAVGAPRTPQSATVTGIVFRVTIERVTATNNFDGDPFFDKADFFGRVRIGPVTSESPTISNSTDIFPNWQFSNTVFMDDTLDDEVVTMTIGVWDADDFNNRQEADLTQTTFTRSVEVNVDVNLCLVPGTAGALSGNVSGACGQSIVTEGLLGPGLGNTARVQFRIEAERPPSAPGLNMLCTHSPIWPQAGQTVTVSAQSLADNLSPKLVDQVDVFLQNQTTVAASCVGTDTCSAAAIAPASGNTMFYGCQIKDASGTVWSGWRRVQVGNPPSGQAVPLIFTGSSRSRVDIVFMPDPDSYTGALDPAFLTDVHDAIRQGYFRADMVSAGGIADADRAFGERLFLTNQDRFNFWIAQDAGDIDNDSSGLNCRITLPGNWNQAYSFADSGAILHRDGFRDCALPNQRVFGTEFNEFRTMLHETMHSPFGLADEYCCDSNYFEPNPLPNIYASQSSCLADIANLAEWDAIIGDTPRVPGSCVMDANGVWKSEPDSDDIMTDNMEFNAADIRRVQYLFDRCSGADCGLPAGQRATQRPSGPEDPVPDVEYQTDYKVMVLQGQFIGRLNLTIDNMAVIYGQSPLMEGGAPMLALEARDESATIIDRWLMWHPLLKLGTFDNFGSPKDPQYVHGPAKWGKDGSVTFIIPFSANLATVTITDLSLGQSLNTIDLRPAIEEFCEQHSEDVDCQAIAHEPVWLYLPTIQRQ